MLFLLLRSLDSVYQDAQAKNLGIILRSFFFSSYFPNSTSLLVSLSLSLSLSHPHKYTCTCMHQCFFFKSPSHFAIMVLASHSFLAVVLQLLLSSFICFHSCFLIHPRQIFMDLVTYYAEVNNILFMQGLIFQFTQSSESKPQTSIRKGIRNP